MPKKKSTKKLLKRLRKQNKKVQEKNRKLKKEVEFLNSLVVERQGDIVTLIEDPNSIKAMMIKKSAQLFKLFDKVILIGTKDGENNSGFPVNLKWSKESSVIGKMAESGLVNAVVDEIEKEVETINSEDCENVKLKMRSDLFLDKMGNVWCNRIQTLPSPDQGTLFYLCNGSEDTENALVAKYDSRVNSFVSMKDNHRCHIPLYYTPVFIDFEGATINTMYGLPDYTDAEGRAYYEIENQLPKRSCKCWLVKEPEANPLRSLVPFSHELQSFGYDETNQVNDEQGFKYWTFLDLKDSIKDGYFKESK